MMRCDDLRQGGAHRLRSCGITCGEIDVLATISRKMVELGLRCIDVFELPYADASQRRPSERVISVRRFSDDRPRRAVEEAALRMWQASEYGLCQGQSARYRAARPVDQPVQAAVWMRQASESSAARAASIRR